MITKVTPTVTTPMTDAWVRTSWRLSTEKNSSGLVRQPTTTSAASTPRSERFRRSARASRARSGLLPGGTAVLVGTSGTVPGALIAAGSLP
jgi:hypothetical protein